ncbi:unnamed protein product [Polarella glacialis]|uniref:Reverse transcriptase Ty1/copia-type domain-containing protein n=1 Tax=Polarella glacialis TaxID=89957 RepID=A0A813JIT4_POLGL|nr:unnamed protein product [Polarella glacialis]
MTAFEQGHGRSFYRDDEIVVDKDGIPHYTGAKPELLKEYKMRATFAFKNLEGDGKDEGEAANDLLVRQKRFAKKLIDALHNKAWEACSELLEADGILALRKVDGYSHVFAALAGIEKEKITRKTEAFKKFFKQSYRRRGTSIPEYLKDKAKKWKELTDLDEDTTLSDDLMAYLILEESGLDEKDQRQHVHANLAGEDGDEEGDDYDEYSNAANEVEEDDEVSDAGASEDDQVYDAYLKYEDSRHKLKEIQKSRGFFKGELTFEERKEAITKEKARSRCSACGRVGHWAGDQGCPKSGQTGPNKHFKSRKGKGKGKKGKRSHSSSTASEHAKYVSVEAGDSSAASSGHTNLRPSFFTLDAVEEHARLAEARDESSSDEQDQKSVRSPGVSSSTTSWQKVKPMVPEKPVAATAKIKTGEPAVCGDSLWKLRLVFQGNKTPTTTGMTFHFEDGKLYPSLPCWKCRAAMGGRRNGLDGEPFFGSRDPGRSPAWMFEGSCPEEKGAHSRLLLAVRVEFAFAAGESESAALNTVNSSVRVNPKTQKVLGRRHQLVQGEGLDESRVALLDTACTFCMHSLAWRVAFEKSLPPGLKVENTGRFKVFHFADGSKTAKRVPVMKIPLGIIGFIGEAHSAELETGTTPLLLSIPAQEALDTVLFIKRQVVQFLTLSTEEVPLLKTRTRHLAVRIDEFGKRGGTAQVTQLDATSVRDDFHVYLAEAELEITAVEFEVTDKRGEMKAKRFCQLNQSMQNIIVNDSRTWVALRHTYTLAEAHATRQFRNSVVFEPFGGCFVVTRIASEEYGWTNSQPLDKLDGYDLLTTSGRKLALHMVVDICKHRRKRGRFYLVENPAGALSWVFEGILLELLDSNDDSVPDGRQSWYVHGAQCPFGKRDCDTSSLTQQISGYLSNCQAVLNRIAVPCTCEPGSYQQVIGRNNGGNRSQQAAALSSDEGFRARLGIRDCLAYPPDTCRAICEGILDMMRICYAADQAGQYEAYPVEDFEMAAEEEATPGADPEPAEAAERPKARAKVKKPLGLKEERSRGRPVRPRALRQGAWIETMHAQQIQNILDNISPQVGVLTVLCEDHAFTKDVQTLEFGAAEVKLFMMRKKPKTLMLPQPHMHPAEVPPRTAYITLAGGQIRTLGWEDWLQQSVAQRVRALPEGTLWLLMVYGEQIGAKEPKEEDTVEAAERERLRRWNMLPRELKAAVIRVHENLGHPKRPELLRALRISRASEAALRAARLFRCNTCPRVVRPHIARPSKLPTVDEFNVVTGFDCFSCKDAGGVEWLFLGMVCLGSSFHVVALLSEANKNPSASMGLEVYELSWGNWAGDPEVGIIADRTRSFLGHIAKVERHDGIWKAMFEKVAWAKQVQGRDEVMMAASEVTQAKNSLSRRSGFSSTQWVLGRDIRLPADLMDDGEVERIGAQAAAATPTSRFHRKAVLRAAAREAHAQVANDDAIRRAELRQTRPTRGPFAVGDWVFYYDQIEQGKRPMSPMNWRGLARVIGHEGKHTVWLAHRGIMIAAAPEHLSHASDEELRMWMVTAIEVDLVDATPAAGGAAFVDIRTRPKPPERWPEDEDSAPIPQPEEFPASVEAEPPAEADPAMEADVSDTQSQHSDAVRKEMEISERDAKKAVRSSLFFKSKQKTTRTGMASRMSTLPEETAAEVEPAVIDAASSSTRPLGAETPSSSEGMDAVESAEREMKRQRLLDDLPSQMRRRQDEPMGESGKLAIDFMEDLSTMDKHLKDEFETHSTYFTAQDVSWDEYYFGATRNRFESEFVFLLKTENQVKKGSKKVNLSELTEDLRKSCTGPGGSDAKEWQAWLDMHAAEIITLENSLTSLEFESDIIVPMRWVRTNKNQGLVDADWLAKSRLVVQGFKDRTLGLYRRDAPTASAQAEAMVLQVTASLHFVAFFKDVKNAYFSGLGLQRRVLLKQPRGGLPGLDPGQLLLAKKAIYGFAEAARMYWLAFRDALLSDGWKESRLEPALFFLRQDHQLVGLLVTHVDDVCGGATRAVMETGFEKTAKRFNFAKSSEREFIFRGREVKQQEDSSIDVTMPNYALSMRAKPISRARRQTPAEPLTEEEQSLLLQRGSELAWIARQLRADLAYQSGVVHHSKAESCVGDLVILNQAIADARRGADYRQRYPSALRLEEAVVLILADSGHANGAPSHDDIARYKSVGGYFLVLANPEVLNGKEAASHLAEAIESADWLVVLLEEVMSEDLDLKNWQDVVFRRKRVYVTDSQSVFDYLQREGTSTSSDKHMAIEGALLRETVRQPNAEVRWIDGLQNIADILTESGADMECFRKVLKECLTSLVQTQASADIKEKNRVRRASRKVVVKATENKEAKHAERRQKVAAQVGSVDVDGDV